MMQMMQMMPFRVVDDFRLTRRVVSLRLSRDEERGRGLQAPGVLSLRLCCFAHGISSLFLAGTDERLALTRDGNVLCACRGSGGAVGGKLEGAP